MKYPSLEDFFLWLKLCSHHSFIVSTSKTIGKRYRHTSFFNEIKREQPIKRIKLRQQAADEAFSYYNAHWKHETDILMAGKRLEIYNYIIDFMTSFLTNEKHATIAKIKRFAEFIEANGSEAHVSMKDVLHHLKYQFEIPNKEHIRLLFGHWPTHCTRTRAEIKASGHLNRLDHMVINWIRYVHGVNRLF